ncbi:MAG TPA: hypothetical protein VHD62_04675 [Opitutaceae bacterium]|nr:hypothetical protein [Opitutaceae bacterium]
MKSNSRIALLLASSLAFAGLLRAADSKTNPPAAPTPDNYPLTVCVVSGDKLGEMGRPVEYVYKQPGKPDRIVRFCCKDCIKDFEKEPAKYLQKLDEAAAAKTKDAGAPASPAHQH